ncbi:MAG: xanthine dehydrogenase family protein molybdopterin-binding subunit [Acidobacteria bacterium]|nr:xanthine dehydrogenase family protein molybdopterin-binding subunit [Acidobacteriota bacterium]
MRETKYVGRKVLRKEDPRLLSGKGAFVDDIHLPATAHLILLRSPHAHARIRRLDVSRARSLPGVLEALTGEEMRGTVPPIPPMGTLPDLRVPEQYPLALEWVRYVGEPVAAVVAENPYIARDALDLIEVDYEPLPVVADPEKALQPGSPLVHPQWKDNVAGTFLLASGNVDAAFRKADCVVKARLVNQRLAPVSLECRAVQANYQPGEKMLTVWSATQIPHLLRGFLAQWLKMPDNRIRVIAPDVGGGFGGKLNFYREEALVPWLAMRLGCPVKWVETRRENLLATIHGRDQINYVELALAKDGRLLGLKCRTIADIGAYLQLLTAAIPTLTALMALGCYKIPALSFEITEVFTHKIATDAYRGAGRPEATYLIERMVDVAAAELKMDPSAIRLRNFPKPKEFPYTTATGVVFDSGNYAGALKKALQLAGYAKLRAKQKQMRRQGKLMGIGLSTYVEICAMGPASGNPPGGGWESATVRVEPSGKVTVLSGSSPHGQGEETTFAQIAAEQLGISIEDVVVIHGDTVAVPSGVGTFGSRSTAVGGSAVWMSAQKIQKKMQELAAHLLGISPKNMVWRNGKMVSKTNPKKFKTYPDVVRAAYMARNLPPGMEPGLEATSYFSPPNYTFPFGAHVCVVEIERETGEVKIVKYVAVDDCGKVINPMTVEGQVQGGIAQGIGQALYEEIVYDENGQLLTGTLMDYAIPKAAQLPQYVCARTETPTPVNPLGAKGVGEAGTIGATPVVVNAVVDALAPYGVRHLDMPLRPEKIWRILREKRPAAPA